MQRVFTPLFEGDTVFVSPDVEKAKQSLLVAMIKNYGGEAHKGRTLRKVSTFILEVLYRIAHFTLV